MNQYYSDRYCIFVTIIWRNMLISSTGCDIWTVICFFVLVSFNNEVHLEPR